MDVSFIDGKAIIRKISLAELTDMPTNGLTNKRTISSKLKGKNKYFGYKKPSDWSTFIRKKIEMGCISNQSRLCASLAVDTLDEAGSTFAWKMFDLLGDDAVADMKNIGFETSCTKIRGLNVCDITVQADNDGNVSLSQMLKLAGMGLPPETARLLERLGTEYGDWLDWITGDLPASATSRMSFRISIPETNSSMVSIQLTDCAISCFKPLSVFDLKLDGQSAWLNMSSNSYAGRAINYFADKIRLPFKIDDYENHLKSVNNRIDSYMIDNTTSFNLDIDSKKVNRIGNNNSSQVSSGENPSYTYTDVKVSWSADQEYNIEDLYNSFFDIDSEFNIKSDISQLKIKVPRPEDASEVYFRFVELPASTGNVKHRRYIALCGIQLSENAIEGAFKAFDFDNLLSPAKIVTARKNEAKVIERGLNTLVPVYAIKQNLNGSLDYSYKLFNKADKRLNGKVCD